MIRYYLLLVLCFCGFSGLGQIKNTQFRLMLDSTYKNSVPLISVEEFKQLDKTKVYVLDVREEDEFEVSHIKIARQVGYYWFDMRKVYDIPKDATIVVYCTVGNRGEKIGDKLERAGYKHVYNLYGGILEWINAGYPVYKSNGVQTSEIHTYNRELARWVERGAKIF